MNAGTLCGLVVGVLTAVGLARAVVGGENESVVRQAAAIFSSIEQKYDKVSSLRYDVQRCASSETQTIEERWSFFFAQPSRVRIDVYSPHERILVINDKSMTEYVPALRRAVITDLSKRSEEERSKVVSSVLSRIALEGIRIGSHEEMAARAEKIIWNEKHPAEVVIEGSNPGYRVAVDTNRRVVVSMEVRGTDGHVIVKADAYDFVQAAPDFWMPTRLVWVQSASRAILRFEARLSNVAANEQMPADRFVVKLPSGTEVENR